MVLVYLISDTIYDELQYTSDTMDFPLMTKLFTTGYRVVSSNWFFWLLVGLCAIQSTWIALSSVYPMAFDEDFHFGIIKLYANHPSPIWTGQPDNANQYGSIATDPSYLYHLVMSIPYRVIALVTDNQAAQVIVLRLLNVAMFVAALPIWRRVMTKMGATAAITNTVMAIFILIPIVPLLSGQINYDNAMFLLLAAISLATINLVAALKTAKTFPLQKLLWLLSLTIAASIVKYAFLPFTLVIVVAVCIAIWKREKSIKRIASAVRSAYRKNWGISLGVATFAFILLLFLAVQRDGVNVIKYHTVTPSCNAVLTVEQCLSYGPWARDYRLEQQKSATPHNPVDYMGDWLFGMWKRSLFTLAGPQQGYQTRGPFVLPAYTSLALVGFAAVAIVIKGWSVWRRGTFALKFMLWLTVIYIAVLWLDGFEVYTRTARPVAINGRYLLMILLPLGVFAVQCMSALLGKRRNLKLVLVSIAIVGMVWGGGVLTFVLRSNQTWYWQNSVIIEAHKSIQNVLGPVVPGYNSPTQFLVL